MRGQWKGWILPLGGAALFAVAVIGLAARFIANYRPVSPDALPVPVTHPAPPRVAAEGSAVQSLPRTAPEPAVLSPAVDDCRTRAGSTVPARPCAPDAAPGEVDPPAPSTVHTPPPPQAPAVSPAPPPTPAVQSSAPTLCDAIELELRDVETALHQPFTQSRGDYLRARLQQLNGELSEQRCGR